MLRLDCTTDQLRAWHDAPHATPRADVVLQVEGPGAIACLQGLFTNDIERATPGAVLWGAVLTPKGMIITDLWLWRRQADVVVIVPEPGADALLELFRKSFPPRLARVRDDRDTHSVWWLTGGEVGAPDDVTVLQPSGPAPFRALAVGPRHTTTQALSDAGWTVAPPSAADVLALLAGWPVLGREIDARTLVQEVRFDALLGVRYDKGCFVGQETVSRLHFRGHPNRTLRAVIGRSTAPESAEVLGADQREVGTAATLLRCGNHWLASVRLRREVPDGEVVQVGGHHGTVHQFPVGTDQLT
jgi:folate-binding protein YgfZ